MKPRARNSARYQVTLGEQWRQHASPDLGIRFLGTIQRGMHVGALGVRPDGSYVCVDGQEVTELVQRKVEVALAATGPQVYPP